MQNRSNSTRRRFLSQVVALGAVGVVGGETFDAASGRQRRASARTSRSLDLLTAADFRSHVGDIFRIERNNGSTLQAELVHVRLSNPAKASPSRTRDPFSLLFRVHGTERLPHQTYAIDHAKMGRYDIFLGSVGSPRSQIQVEAIF